jgi:hypothetical protein
VWVLDTDVHRGLKKVMYLRPATETLRSNSFSASSDSSGLGRVILVTGLPSSVTAIADWEDILDDLKKTLVTGETWKMGQWNGFMERKSKARKPGGFISTAKRIFNHSFPCCFVRINSIRNQSAFEGELRAKPNVK